MRTLLLITCLGFATVLAGCRHDSRIQDYWSDTDIAVTQSNYQQSEDRFARFSEEAIKAPSEDAVAALDSLFNKLKADDVYSDWMVRSFYSILSPCRSAMLFGAAVNRIKEDGVLDAYYIERMERLLGYIQLNNIGDRCALPPGSINPDGKSTLYLVLDITCPSCIESLKKLSSDQSCEERVALCFGGNSAPRVDGWKYCFPSEMEAFFDLESTPVWFTTTSSGIIDRPYTFVQ